MGVALRREPGEVLTQYRPPATADCLFCGSIRRVRLPDVSEQQKMLDAHVKFELRKWQGAALNKTLSTEINAVLDWLDAVPVNDLLADRKSLDAAVAAGLDASTSPLIAEVVVIVAKSIHANAKRDSTKLAALVGKDAHDELADAIIGMKELRRALIAQVTQNDAYSQLISHVMYQGIKNYIQAENVIARKVPGASTLMKMGQSAVSAAAPKLEKAIDKQLTAFISSNVSDSVRESQRYLDKALDDNLLHLVADEVWDSNANSTVSELAGIFSPASIDQVIHAVHGAWVKLRASKVLTAAVDQAITSVLKAYGQQTVGELLKELGIERAELVEVVTPIAKPVITRAVKDGFLEQRIRANLEPFYAEYFKN